MKTNDKFFIPGSSLKGAIRTSLLYNLINADDIPEDIVQKRSGKYRIKRGACDNFINKIFSAPKGNSAQNSIMRFLQISDSTVAKFPHVYDLKTIKAKPTGTFEDHGRNGRVIKTYVETIGRKTSLKFSLNNTVNDDVLNRIGIEDKKYLISLKNIKESIYNFSNDIIDHEIEFYEEYDRPSIKKTYEKLSKWNKLDKPLIKLGSGSGLLATSIALKIKNEDIQRFEEIRQSFRRSYEYEFPKSRKITSTDLPLGWVQLSFAEPK
nr:type III-A CRISPR-associated RAMP protein Csm5 [uncultured Methanobrevibacter sp.]